MKKFAENFYKSTAWKECRRAYAKSKGMLCEDCGEPGEIVHHVIELDELNINDPNVTLNFNNLKLLCRKCHGVHHRKNKDQRYFIDSEGKVFLKRPP